MEDPNSFQRIKTNIDPRHLLHVRAIAQAKSFAKASLEIGLSQPALSKSIAVLERRLGVKVFDRSRTGAVLNDAGHILLRNAEGLVDMLERTADEVQLAAKSMQGPLTLGVTSGLVPRFLPDVLNKIHEEETGFNLSITERTLPELIAELEAGKLDIAVGPVLGKYQMPRDIEEEPLFNDPFNIVHGPHSDLEFTAPVKLKSLIHHPWILPPKGGNYVHSFFEAANAPWPHNCITTMSLPLIIATIQTTNRLTITSRIAAMGFNTELSTLPLTEGNDRQIGILRRKTLTPSPLGSRLIEALRDVASSAPYQID